MACCDQFEEVSGSSRWHAAAIRRESGSWGEKGEWRLVMTASDERGDGSITTTSNLSDPISYCPFCGEDVN